MNKSAVISCICYPLIRLCWSPYTCVDLCLIYSFVVLCVYFILVILAGGDLAGIHPHHLTAAKEDAATEVGNIHNILPCSHVTGAKLGQTGRIS